ncbi:MAG: antibiotic biosynthesis monooxygenase [Proteobacteria bacterium]|nr:antibiotic biosynthesis monooxygenase [Pseudomonadota bacterium]
MIVLIGTFRLPPERLDEARPPMERVVRASRAEAGCLEYAYAEDLFDPGLIRVSEKWASREHLAAHFKASHMQQWIAERAALGLFDRAITLFQADEGTAV